MRIAKNQLIFSLFAFVFLVIVVTCLAAGWLQPANMAVLALVPYVLWPVNVILGLRFNRGRLVLAMLLTAPALYFLAIYHPTEPFVWRERGLLFAQLALPLALGLLAWKKERGLLTSSGLPWTVFTIFTAFFPIILFNLGPEYFTAFFNWLNGLLAGHKEQAVIGATLLGIVSALYSFYKHKSTMDAAYLFMILALCLANHQVLKNPFAGLVLYIAGALIMLVGLLEMFHKLAFNDELTGLPARRALMESMAKLSGTYALAMTDIDHFKKFNDTYGHDTGDLVLREVAGFLQQVGGGGRVYRFGGEEFTIIFNGLHSEEAARYLDEVREKIAQSPLKVSKPAKGKKPAKECLVKITISMGVAEPDKNMPDPAAVLKGADKALYQAKEGGRNQVRCLGDKVEKKAAKKPAKKAGKNEAAAEKQQRKTGSKAEK